MVGWGVERVGVMWCEEREGTVVVTVVVVMYVVVGE